MGIKPGDQVDFQALPDGAFLVRPKPVALSSSAKTPDHTAHLVSQFIAAGQLVPAKNRAKNRKFGTLRPAVDLNDLLDAERGQSR